MVAAVVFRFGVQPRELAVAAGVAESQARARGSSTGERRIDVLLRPTLRHVWSVIYRPSRFVILSSPAVGPGALELVNNADQAIEGSPALRSGFHSDELQSDGHPALVRSLTVSYDRIKDD